MTVLTSYSKPDHTYLACLRLHRFEWQTDPLCTWFILSIRINQHIAAVLNQHKTTPLRNVGYLQVFRRKHT